RPRAEPVAAGPLPPSRPWPGPGPPPSAARAFSRGPGTGPPRVEQDFPSDRLTYSGSHRILKAGSWKIIGARRPRNNRSHVMKSSSPPSNSPDRFTGLRVAVTGGTSGLGLALVRELLGRGARVAFVARTPDRVARVAREHAGAHGIVGDF